MPKTLELSATADKGKNTEKTASAAYQIGENLAENASMFGEDVVNSMFLQDLRVYLQNVIRSELKKGKSEKEIQEYLKTVKPGVKRAATAMDPKVALKATLAAMSPEERKAFIADLMKG